MVGQLCVYQHGRLERCIIPYCPRCWIWTRCLVGEWMDRFDFISSLLYIDVGGVVAFFSLSLPLVFSSRSHMYACRNLLVSAMCGRSLGSNLFLSYFLLSHVRSIGSDRIGFASRRTVTQVDAGFSNMVPAYTLPVNPKYQLSICSVHAMKISPGNENTKLKLTQSDFDSIRSCVLLTVNNDQQISYPQALC